MSKVVSFFLSQENEVSLIEELWDYMRSTYFDDSAYVFENLNLGSGTFAFVRNLLFGIFVGFIIAAFCVTFDKRFLGNFVRKLLAAGAVGRENAVTLEQLSVGRGIVIRHCLKRGVNLRRVVKCAEEEDYNNNINKRREEYEGRRAQDSSLPPFKQSEYTVNTYTDHFYVPENCKYAAEAKFDGKGTTWPGFAIFTLVAVICFIVLLVLMPKILGIVDGFVGIFADK